MKIKVPKFMRKMAAKCVSNMIYEDCGINIDIDFHELVLETSGANCHFRTAQTFTLNKRDLKKIVKEGL